MKWVLAGCVAMAAIGCGDDERAALDAGPSTVDTVAAVDTVAPNDVGADTVTQADADAVGPGDTVAPELATVMALCEPLARATCRVYVGCRTGAAPAAVEQCEGHARAVCEATAPATAARMAAGTLVLDTVAADACFVQATFGTCGTLDERLAELGPACATVFAGAVGAGEACGHAGDCASGLVCRPGAAGACPGTCELPGNSGATCNAMTPCAADHLCDAGRCIPVAIGLTDDCALNSQCPSGMFCDDATARCTAVRGAQGACDDDAACEPDLYCAFIEGADSGACAPRLPAGATCLPFDGGEPCVAGHACDMETSLCVALPEAAGDACVETWRPCVRAGLYCDFDASTCRAEPQLGADCGGLALPSRCQFGWCDAPNASAALGRCETFAAPGAACADPRECGALACVDGTCQRPVARACHPLTRDLDMGLTMSLLSR